MATQVIGAVVLFLTLAVGIYNWVKRMKSERRRLADEAKAKLEDAKKNDSPSDFLDAFGKLRGM